MKSKRQIIKEYVEKNIDADLYPEITEISYKDKLVYISIHFPKYRGMGKFIPNMSNSEYRHSMKTIKFKEIGL